jgi:hypothetical protein
MSLCHEHVCRELCAPQTSCSLVSDACIAGVCAPPPAAECESDADCTKPRACETPGTGKCSSGMCAFEPLPGGSCDDGNPCTDADVCDSKGVCGGALRQCQTPPAPSCTADDSTYLFNLGDGWCDLQTGDCKYPIVEMACTECRLNCLQVCANIDCSVPAGTCTAGRCDPHLEPPACVFENRTAGTTCYLGSETDLMRGVCLDGACVDCLSAANCTTPPARPDCFAVQCASNACEYTALATKVCQAAQCTTGWLRNERLCGAGGDCADAGGQACQSGLACAADAASCLMSCASDGDCVLGNYCEANFLCAAKHTDGSACAGALGGRDCLSGHCQNGFCCPSGACCAGDADCASFIVAPACTDVPNCHGARTDAVCNQTSHACDVTTSSADSACQGQKAIDCPNNLADRYCGITNLTCPADCNDGSGNPDLAKCDPGMVCDSSTSFQCQVPPGVGHCCGATCPGITCMTGLHCGDSGQTPGVDVCCATARFCCSDDTSCASLTPGYRCDLALAHCNTACDKEDDSDGKCQSGFHCDGTTCTADLGPAASCNEDSDCISRHCADGVCCDTACTGQVCQRCDALSHSGAGICDYVGDNTKDPDNECSQGSTTADGCKGNNCSGSGYACAVQPSGDGGCPACQKCDGSGFACIPYGPNTQDASGCNSLCKKCDGSGACVIQAAGEDQFNQCTAGVLPGLCAGDNCRGGVAECEHLAGQQGCPQCEGCTLTTGTNYACIDQDTKWGEGSFGCSNPDQRCVKPASGASVCRTCGVSGTLLPDNCSGCAAQGRATDVPPYLACWHMSAGQSCDAVCNAGYGGCVAANWNDNNTCDNCKTVSGNATAPCENSFCTSGNCPLSSDATTVCYVRSSGNQTCGGSMVNYHRYCVCKY